MQTHMMMQQSMMMQQAMGPDGSLSVFEQAREIKKVGCPRPALAPPPQP